MSFWSTALAEAAGLLVIVASPVRLLIAGGRDAMQFCRTRASRIAFIFFGVYSALVAVSYLVAPGPFHRNPSLLWHPLLFPALLIPAVRRATLIRAAKIFLAGGAASAVVTLLLNFRGREAGGPVTFTGLTTFADLLALCAVTGLVIGLRRKPFRLASWPLAACALVLPAVAWSGERAPIVALAGAGTARAARAGPRFLLAWLGVAVACAAFTSPTFTEKMGWMLRGGSVDRYVVWNEGLKLVPGTPLLGYGPGSFAGILPAEAWGRFVQRPPWSWHDDMLETWLDSGPLAALALAGLLVVGVVQAVRGMIAAREGRVSVSGEAGLLFILLVLFGMVGSVVTTSVLGLVFWALLGMTLNPPE